MSDFLAKVATAKAEAQRAGEVQWVETSPEIIAYLNPRGLGGAKHFAYQGVLVCEHGKREEIEADMETPLAHKLHGKQEGAVSFKG